MTQPDTTCDHGNHLMCIEDCPCSCHQWDAIREQQKARHGKDATVRGLQKSRAQKVTPCPTCRRVVGVWQTGFANHKSAHAFGPTAKIAAHHGADSKRCPSSQLAINADVIFDRAQS